MSVPASASSVAAGSGNAAIPAAMTGAEVVATDLTPELSEAGRRDADRHGTRSHSESGSRKPGDKVRL
nr:hypothetical protein [Phytoactinopolyspora halotolerans]